MSKCLHFSKSLGGHRCLTCHEILTDVEKARVHALPELMVDRVNGGYFVYTSKHQFYDGLEHDLGRVLDWLNALDSDGTRTLGSGNADARAMRRIVMALYQTLPAEAA